MAIREKRDFRKGKKQDSNHMDLKPYYFIMGKNTIRAMCKDDSKQIIKVFTTCKQDSLLDTLKHHNINVDFIQKDHLFRLVESESHQGFVAKVKKRAPLSFNDVLEREDQKESSLIIALDTIFDPQNLGAILRSAYCLGASCVIWSKNRGASITPVVTKVSVGASELMDVSLVSNLVESIKKAKEYGYEAVSCELKEGAESIYTCQFSKKTLLLLGSEEKGVRELLSKQMDKKVMIPMNGIIDSLNVSSATAVFLSHWKSQVEKTECERK